MQCHRALQSVEIALTKKLINRGATRFLCLNCLGKKFGVSEETLLQKAKEFREMEKFFAWNDLLGWEKSSRGCRRNISAATMPSGRK